MVASDVGPVFVWRSVGLAHFKELALISRGLKIRWSTARSGVQRLHMSLFFSAGSLGSLFIIASTPAPCSPHFKARFWVPLSLNWPGKRFGVHTWLRVAVV